DVVDLRDVRVVEGGGEPRLVEEHLDKARALDVLRQDPLHDHQFLEALDAGRAREVELRHTANRDLSDQVILAEPVTRPEMTRPLCGRFHHPAIRIDERVRRCSTITRMAKAIALGVACLSVAACSPYNSDGSFACTSDNQ